MKMSMRFRQPQQGIALAVGLVMLLILTLLGVSAMNMSTMELRMAANQQNKNLAFQRAAAILEQAFNINNLAEFKKARPEENPPVIAPLGADAQGAEASLVASFDRPSRPCRGGMMGASDLMLYECDYFDLIATGRHQASGAVSVQQEGVFVLGPNKKQVDDDSGG